MRINLYLTSVALLGFAMTVSATTVTYSFLENGLGNLGSSSTFTESGISLTAYASPSESLYAKNEGPGEVGLGTLSDGEHEINTGNFVQLAAATSPTMEITTLYFGSIQAALSESVDIYYSTSLGSLGTLLGTVSTSGSTITSSFDVSSWGYLTGYYGITAGVGNIELAGVTVGTPSYVPDAGSTAALLGGALTMLAVLRRRLAA